MTERIDLPADGRSTAFVKSVVEILQSPRHLIDDTLIVCGGLVVHAPTAADNLQPTLGHQLLYLVLQLRWLFVPPFKEEHALGVDETSLWIAQQRMHHRIDDLLYASLLDSLFFIVEVLIDRFEPANVIVRVRH